MKIKTNGPLTQAGIGDLRKRNWKGTTHEKK